MSSGPTRQEIFLTDMRSQACTKVAAARTFDHEPDGVSRMKAIHILREPTDRTVFAIPDSRVAATCLHRLTNSSATRTFLT